MAGDPWYLIDLVKLRTALSLILWSDLELVKLKLVHHAVLKGIHYKYLEKSSFNI